MKCFLHRMIGVLCWHRFSLSNKAKAAPVVVGGNGLAAAGENNNISSVNAAARECFEQVVCNYLMSQTALHRCVVSIMMKHVWKEAALQQQVIINKICL